MRQEARIPDDRGVGGWGGTVSFLIPIFGVFKFVSAKRMMHKLLVPKGSSCKGKKIYKCCSTCLSEGL
jgi:hypothetical protein